MRAVEPGLLKPWVRIVVGGARAGGGATTAAAANATAAASFGCHGGEDTAIVFLSRMSVCEMEAVTCSIAVRGLSPEHNQVEILTKI